MAYADTLIKMVKATGQELIDRAEELVGRPEWVTSLDIWLRFPQGLDDVPTIEVSTSVVSRNAFDVMRSKED